MKTKFLYVIPVTILLVSVSGCLKKKSATDQKSEYRIWYDEPADDWNEALPIGNGRLGAMVIGDVNREAAAAQ